MKDFRIRDFGAIGDGVTMNTEAIQRTIDACHEYGGGRVILDEGVFLTGTITLRSNVDFHISRDAVLLGSPDWRDYPERQHLRHIETDKMFRNRNACMIFAEDRENISITGMGTIDAHGSAFVYPRTDGGSGPQYIRIDAPTPPRVVFFSACRHVRIEDITMTNQPSGWSYLMYDCDDVKFDRCRIWADVQYPNNDGIDIVSSRDVTVSNCSITCGDDCIAVRANNAPLKENKITERVCVTNCNLTSYANGIRIAWINDGTIRNCVFSNLVMTDTNVGICIQCPERREGKLPDVGREATLVENLSFSNIVMDGTYGHPIFMEISECPQTTVQAFRNIRFSGITANGLEFPHVYGRAENKLKNITFTDCSFRKVSDDVLPNCDIHGFAKEQRRPGSQLFRHVENLVLNNTSFTEMD